MSLPIPLARGITVYGRAGCGYSSMAQQLISGRSQTRYYNLNQYLNDPREFFNLAQRRIRSHRTFPIVFVDQQFIGGFSELQSYLSRRG